MENSQTVLILGALLVLGALSSSIFKYLRMPSTVGLIVVGFILGPECFKLIHQTKEVQFLADLGIALLLFTIGLHIDMERITRAKKEILIAGFLQIFLCLVVFFPIGKMLFGFANPETFILGLIFSLSSTALVLKFLQELWLP